MQTGAKSRRNVPRFLKFLIASTKASPATNSNAIFVALTKHVTARAKPVQIASVRLGRSSASTLSNPRNAIPKQSGESESLVIEETAASDNYARCRHDAPPASSASTDS